MSDYIIASVPRSGSSLLCELLRLNGAGDPKEHFNPRFGRSRFTRAVAEGVSTEAHLAKMREEGTIDGIFASKIMSEWVEQLLQNAEVYYPGAREFFEANFPGAKYIVLTRKDRIRQAISGLRASRSMQFRKFADDASAPKDAGKQPFTAMEIYAGIMAIARREQLWRQFLHEMEVEPLYLTYEELEADMEGTVVRCLEFLALPRPDPINVEVSHSKQRDGESEAFRERFLKRLDEVSRRQFEENREVR